MNLTLYTVIKPGLTLPFEENLALVSRELDVGTELLFDGYTLWVESNSHLHWIESMATPQLFAGILAGGFIREGADWNSRKTTLPGGTCLAARIESVWNTTMHDVLGYRDYCDSTTSFTSIDYAYTKDAPAEVVRIGEGIWDALLARFQGEDDMGQVTIARKDHNGNAAAPGGPGILACITRRKDLWDK